MSKKGKIPRKTRQPKKEAFLAAYAECGVITQAAKTAKCNRNMHYEWLNDQEYKKRFEDAHEQACDNLEQEARRRAIEGWDEPVYQNGVKCGVKRKRSDTLLIFLMKGAMPDKYKERVSQEVDAKISATAKIIEDEDWYGNQDRFRSSSKTDAASTAGPA